MVVLREDQDRARRKLAELERPDLDAGQAVVTALMELLDRPQDLYRLADDATRKTLNEAFFTRVDLAKEDDDTSHISGDQVTEYLSPFVEVARARTGYRKTNGAAAQSDSADKITRASLLAAALSGTCSSKTAMVDPRGFEPLTPSMRTRCATGLRYSP